VRQFFCGDEFFVNLIVKEGNLALVVRLVVEETISNDTFARDKFDFIF